MSWAHPCSINRRSKTTVVGNDSWSWEFRMEDSVPGQEDMLLGEFDLPASLKQPEGIRDFFEPPVKHLCTGPSKLLDKSSAQTLRDLARLLKFFKDLEDRALDLVREDRVMEAILLITSRWQLHGEASCPLMQLVAQRSLRDKAPAFGMLASGFLGPIAMIPAVILANEAIVRRVGAYGGLVESTPSGYDLMIASMKHHFVRSLYDPPRIVKLQEHYTFPTDLELNTLEEAFEEQSLAKLVEGSLGDEI